MLPNNTYVVLELARQRQASRIRVRPAHVELSSYGRRRRRRSLER